MNEISKSEKEFLGLMIGEKEKKTKAISREARKIVREKISKWCKKIRVVILRLQRVKNMSH